VAIEIKPLSCEIDSRLGNLADAISLIVVEQDPAAPATPTAAAWRTLDRESLISVKLGLTDLDLVDYGEYRVDNCELDTSGFGRKTRIQARDKAAKLIEDPLNAGFEYGTWVDDDPAFTIYPSARSIIKNLALRQSLGLIWDAPNYTPSGFSVQANEPASSAILRLLAPLRASLRHPVDAWVDGDDLVVRRRGNGTNVGELDCALGEVRSLKRSQELLKGNIVVFGADYSYLEPQSTDPELLRAIPPMPAAVPPSQPPTNASAADNAAEVVITQLGPNSKRTETYITDADGKRVLATRETEQSVYQDALDPDTGRWLGRVLYQSITTEELNLHLEAPRTERKSVTFGYDEQWRTVLRDERNDTYDEDGKLVSGTHVVVRYEQITPTDVRTTTTEYRVDSEGAETVKTGYPKWEQAPGTLQNGIQQSQDEKAVWAFDPQGGSPSLVKWQKHTSRYYAIASGGGLVARAERVDLVTGNAACQAIADDLAAESGKWRYEIQLFWPRPFSYRKGQVVNLVNLPSGPDLDDAIITAVRTTYDEGQGVWTHDVELEWWGDA
jgi:hypothetical protein